MHNVQDKISQSHILLSDAPVPSHWSHWGCWSATEVICRPGIRDGKDLTLLSHPVHHLAEAELFSTIPSHLYFLPSNFKCPKWWGFLPFPHGWLFHILIDPPLGSISLVQSIPWLLSLLPPGQLHWSYATDRKNTSIDKTIKKRILWLHFETSMYAAQTHIPFFAIVSHCKLISFADNWISFSITALLIFPARACECLCFRLFFPPSFHAT